MKIKQTARGYEATVTVPVVSGTPSAPDDDGTGEAQFAYDKAAKALLVFDRSQAAWQPAGGTVIGGLTAANNLSDVASTSQSRINLSAASFADWPLTTLRTYAISNSHGNDANVKPYADPATSSSADYAVSCAAAGATPLRTFAALGAILPRVGQGRSVEIVIEGDASTYAGDIPALISGCIGYSSILVRGTATNTTAGCSAFDGSVADATFLGATTVTGMNVNGYNPTGTPTTTVVQRLMVGGGAPSFAVEPTMPAQGYRIRFNANAPTQAALRNICVYAVKVAGTDTLTFSLALPIAPIATDVFYLEKAGIVFSGTTTLTGAGGATLNIAGLSSAASWSMQDTRLGGFSLCQSGTSFSLSDCPVATLRTSYTHPVLGTITSGGSRCGTSEQLY